MGYIILKNIIRKKHFLKIIIFFAVIVVSVAPFIVMSLIGDENINFNDCFIEKVGDDGKTIRIIVHSEKNISELFPVGGKVNVLKTNEKTVSILMNGVVVKKDAIIESPDTHSKNKDEKIICITVRVDNPNKYSLKSGEKVAINRAERLNLLKRFF